MNADSKFCHEELWDAQSSRTSLAAIIALRPLSSAGSLAASGFHRADGESS